MPQLKNLARQLRSNMTDAEQKLWHHIRREQIHNIKFRRQQEISGYIADFVSMEKRLIIELDGGQHNEQIEYDSERTKILESKGFIVLRFWNNDVMNNMDGVLQVISETIQNSSP